MAPSVCLYASAKDHRSSICYRVASLSSGTCPYGSEWFITSPWMPSMQQKEKRGRRKAHTFSLSTNLSLHVSFPFISHWQEFTDLGIQLQRRLGNVFFYISCNIPIWKCVAVALQKKMDIFKVDIKENLAETAILQSCFLPVSHKDPSLLSDLKLKSQFCFF